MSTEIPLQLYKMVDCNELAGVGETLLLKIIVDDGGTTVQELKIDSLTVGSTVI